MLGGSCRDGWGTIGGYLGPLGPPWLRACLLLILEKQHFHIFNFMNFILVKVYKVQSKK